MRKVNETIEIKDIEPMRVAYKTYEGDLRQAGRHMPSVFKAIKGRSNGSPFFSIYSSDPQTKIGKADLCVPTEETPVVNDIFVKETPRVKAACVLHQGSYEELSVAYEQLADYVRTQGLLVTGPCREVYIKGPGALLKGNPKKYLTEIQLPIDGSKADDY